MFNIANININLSKSRNIFANTKNEQNEQAIYARV